MQAFLEQMLRHCKGSYIHILSTIILLMNVSIAQGQVQLSGTIVDEAAEPMIGVNVIVQGSFNGTSSDVLGQYSLEVKAGDTLVFSYITAATQTFIVPQKEEVLVHDIVMKDGSTTLANVVVAGSKLNELEKITTKQLNQLEILTSPGQPGSILAGLDNTEGSTVDPATGQLSVRGGASNETGYYMNGLWVRNPYISTPNAVATRTNQSPYLIGDVEINNGAISAEYDHALSSVVLMNTLTSARDNLLSVNVNTLGANVNAQQQWGKVGAFFNSEWIDLRLNPHLSNSRLDWNTPYQGYNNQALIATESNEFSLLLSNSHNKLDINTFYSGQDRDIGIINDNYAAYLNYNKFFKEQYNFSLSASIQQDQSATDIDSLLQQDLKSQQVQAKAVLKRYEGGNKQKVGLEYIYRKEEEEVAFWESEVESAEGVDLASFAAFGEMEQALGQRWRLQLGGRANYFHHNEQARFTYRALLKFDPFPRFSLSLFHGTFNQLPDASFLFYQKELENERSQQSIFKVAHHSKERDIELAAYHKKYDNLIQYSGDFRSCNCITNNGDGYANGIDLSWTEYEFIPKTKVRLTHSYLHTQRNYLNYTAAKTPSFLYQHRSSLLAHRYFKKLSSNVSLNYTLAFGRQFDNPYTDHIESDRPAPLHQINLNYTYITRLVDNSTTYIHFSVENLLNRKQEVGRRYLGIDQSQKLYSNYGIAFFLAFITEFN